MSKKAGKGQKLSLGEFQEKFGVTEDIALPTAPRSRYVAFCTLTALTTFF